MACRWTAMGCLAGVTVMMIGYVSALTLEVAERTDDVDSTDTEALGLMWGIADTTASVGRLFRYHIPGDAFKGSVDKYEVVEAGKGQLPAWLHFTPGQNVLQGVPAPADAGQLYLEVLAYSSNGKKVSDIFSVTVSQDTQAMSSGQPLRFQKAGPEVVRCKREEPETVATIVVDADLPGMMAHHRLDLFTRFLSHMGLLEEMVKMVPAKAKLLQDDTALVTGAGDAVEPQFPGVAMSWLVGCGKVEPGHFPVLQKLDDDSGNGEIRKALHIPVVGWRVTNTRLQQQQHALKRRRRQARATPTPVVTMTGPTATGEVDVTDTDTMTRQVVVMSSPTFSIEPTPSEDMMPKTMTPEISATTPKMEKPDTIQPSKPPVLPPEATRTPALSTEPPTTTTTTTTSTTTTSTTTTTTTTTEEGPKMEKTTPMAPVPCLKPDVDGKKLEKVVLFVGEVVDYKIPEKLFSACGTGGTSQMELNLFKGTTTRIPDNWFLQFDNKMQVIRGMPLADDVGTYNMTIIANLRSEPFITTHTFKITVRKPKGKKSRVNHELSMTIDTDYNEFMGSLDKKLDLANKVAGVFGDENTSALTVTRIAKGSVVYAFTNNTLAGGNCPVDDITALADKLVTADGRINPEAMEKLKPWVLSGAATAPAGDCEGNPNFPQRSASVSPPSEPDTTTMEPKVTKKPDMTMKPDPTAPVDKTPSTPAMPEKPSTTPAPAPNMTGVATAGKTSDDDIWITTVVPAVVIVAILLIALLIACILYRKKRKGKMNLEDQNTFVNKGAPVIFPDELDDKPNDSTKPLLIEGNPPAPPPEYHRSNSDSPADPRNNHRDNTPPTDEIDAQIETDVTSPLYQPPPPVTASSGKQARPNVGQPYRSQPPEIHP